MFMTVKNTAKTSYLTRLLETCKFFISLYFSNRLK